MIPLQLSVTDKHNKETLLYKCPGPQSFRFLRPLKLMFAKETPETVKREVELLKSEFSKFNECKIETSFGDLSVTCENYLTLLDGKSVNTLTDTTYTLACALCNLTSAQFNTVLMRNAEIDVEIERLDFGGQPLHSYLNCFKFMLGLGASLGAEKEHQKLYKIEQKKGKKVQAKIDKKALKRKIKDKEDTKMREIERRMFKELSLVVNKVKVGFGSSNTGNVARKAFQNPKIFSKITGINMNLVEKFQLILFLFNTEEVVDCVSFKSLCRETSNLLTQLYPWKNWSPTVHKLLCHGPQIMERLVLPVGVFSEQAAETQNKFYRYFREHRARKIDRISTITDIYHRCWDMSDPITAHTIYMSGKKPSRESAHLPDNYKKYLII